MMQRRMDVGVLHLGEHVVERQLRLDNAGRLVEPQAAIDDQPRHQRQQRQRAGRHHFRTPQPPAQAGEGEARAAAAEGGRSAEHAAELLSGLVGSGRRPGPLRALVCAEWLPWKWRVSRGVVGEGGAAVATVRHDNVSPSRCVEGAALSRRPRTAD